MSHRKGTPPILVGHSNIIVAEGFSIEAKLQLKHNDNDKGGKFTNLKWLTPKL
jgi:hypothetical protein